MLPKYCDKCGKELISNEVYKKYDTFSGNPVDIIKKFHCPDFRRFFGRNNGHFFEQIDIVDNQTTS